MLSDDYPPQIGGVATWTSALVAALTQRDRVGVLVRARPGLASGAIALRGPSFSRRGGAYAALALAARWRPGDQVIATTWPMATASVRLFPRVTVVAHGSDVTCEPVDVRGFDRVGRLARWGAVSRFLVDRLAERRVAARLLPAPVDAASEPRRGKGLTSLAFVGRAVPGKGGDRFVRLVAAAGVDGVFVGDGPERVRWQALAERIGARIRFVGSLDRAGVRAVLADSDAAVLLPTADEGLGLALIEAAALGVAAVGCHGGGVPEAVGPGLVLDDPDDATASAEALRSWWTADRGEEAWSWVRDTHGRDRLADAILG